MGGCVYESIISFVLDTVTILIPTLSLEVIFCFYYRVEMFPVD